MNKNYKKCVDCGQLIGFSVHSCNYYWNKISESEKQDRLEKLMIGYLKYRKNKDKVENTYQKISQIRKGKKIPKLSESLKKAYKEGRLVNPFIKYPWLKEKLRQKFKGRHIDEAWRKKMSDTKIQSGISKKMWSQDLRNKQSETFKKFWLNPQFRQQRISNIMKAQHLKPNKKEQLLNIILQQNFPNEWKYVGNGEIIIGGLCPDFINCNGKKKIIELFGDYWHIKKVDSITDTEEGRINFFNKYGFGTLIIWEHELKNSEYVIDKIKDFMGGAELNGN